jgi:hypothetical protein
MNIHDTNITIPFVTCAHCDKGWRTMVEMRCPRCDQAVGIPFRLDALETEHLMGIIRYQVDQRPVMVAIVDDCEWFMGDHPWEAQYIWTLIKEYLEDFPTTPRLDAALNDFVFNFANNIVNVDDNGDMIDEHMVHH